MVGDAVARSTRRTRRAPAPRRPARAGRAPGWPPRPRPCPARCRRPPRTVGADHVVHPERLGVVERLGRAASGRRAASASVRSVTPSKVTSQRCWCGREATTTSALAVRSTARAPGATRSSPIGDQLDDDVAPQPVGLGDPPDLEPRRSSCAAGHAQSTKSTSTVTSSRVAAARTTVRMLCAVRPSRPITRPSSPGRHPHLEQHAAAALDGVDVDRVGVVDELPRTTVGRARPTAVGCRCTTGWPSSTSVVELVDASVDGSSSRSLTA